MRHPQRTSEVVELAALYALGVLDPEEAAAFEAHLAEGCRTCEEEVKTFGAVAGHLGAAVLPETPHSAVRARLFGYLKAAARAEWTIVRSTEGEWEPSGIEGLVTRRLFRDPDGQRFTALARMERGARYPSHRHADAEELYMVEGDLTVEGQELRAGDYCAASAGTVHGVTSSEGGCTFLLHASERDQVFQGEGAGAPQSGLVFVRAIEGSWKSGADPGVRRRTIFMDPARRTVTCLVRMEAGTRLPGHRHVTAEQFYMLEGDTHVSGQVLHAGDYYRAAAGTEHGVTYTEGGCLFLMISSKVEILD